MTQASAPGPETPDAPNAGRTMRLGVTYLYAITTYGYPPSVEDDLRAIREIADMGFHYLEMEGLGEAHSRAVEGHIDQFKRVLADCGVQVHNFCVVDPELVSLDQARRQAAYERFERRAALGATLGAETLHLASYAPPVEYPAGKPYALDEDYAFADTVAVRIPDGFEWQRVWDVLVESCRRCAEVAASLDRTVLMEPRVGEVICSVDSLIRLIDDVAMPNFKANFDTGHFSAQRESVPLALAKLEGRYANIHVSDNHPSNSDHLPPGDAAIDWDEFFRVLKRQGYTGYLGLDLGESPTLADDLKRGAAFLTEAARRQGVALQM